MKRVFLNFSLAVLSLSTLTPQVDAKRLGGGSSVGMQRSVSSTPRVAAPHTPAATPGTPAAAVAAPGATAGAAAAAAPKNSWKGVLGGMALGLGLGALMSHLGLGGLGDFGGIVMLAMVAVLAFMGMRWLMRRLESAATQSGMQFAGAGPGAPPIQAEPEFAPGAVSLRKTPEAPVGLAVPPGFDVAGFEDIAKHMFRRMQAANDAANMNDLRAFTTPEMLAVAQRDLQTRGGAAQTTEVQSLYAKLLDFTQEPQQQVVSVRFYGMVKEAPNAAAEPFDEVWHLVKPLNGKREWAIAGIANQTIS
jgi:predicted lipid-binding transport protein (Tim44 family)